MTLDLLKRDESGAALSAAQHDANFDAIESEVNGKAAASHTHPASEISDSTASGRALLTAGSVAAQQSALNVEDGATADQSAAEILTLLLTVDGPPSGLDADTLDGNHADAFATAAQGALADTAVQPADIDTAAAAAVEDFATAAQGSVADTALQPGDAATVLDGTAYRLLYVDSAGDVQELAHGTSGYVLTSAGASANPAWGALPAASESVAGIVEIADATETAALAATNLAVSPAHLGTEITTALAAAAPGSLPIDDRTGTGMAITLDKTKSGYNHLIDEDATIASDWPAEKILRVTNVDTSDHTLAAGGTGTIDGASSVVVVGNGGSVTVEVRSNAGTAPICYVEGETTQDRTVYGATDFNDKVVSKPELKDYAETSTTPSSSSNVLDLDLENGNVFQVTLSENVTTTTFSNPPATGKTGSILLILIQDSTPRTIVWPTSVKWPGGTAPTLSTGSGDIDIFSFVTRDAGTTWYGFVGGQAFAVPA